MGQNTLSDAEKGRLPTPAEEEGIEALVGGAMSAFMGTPVVADPNLIVTTIDIAAGAATLAAQPDCPRNLTFVLTDANDSVTATVVILGVDAVGRVVREDIQITLGVNKAWTGTKIFATVTSITVSALSGEAGGDAWVVGIGNVIGTPIDLGVASEVVHAFVDGARVTPDAVAVGESTSGIDANGATYDGAKIMYALLKPTKNT